MAIYAVRYTYNHETERQAEVRPAHRVFLKTLLDEGVLLASGPLEGGQALIIIRADDAVAALGILEGDPMNTESLIDSREALQWTAVYGPWA
ncbi:YciI family protein [Trueperella pecoris]|uniref:YCII-related domain-containing protein n=1 Tax=Trueperella pecoris TaxID=2733571 RepID=A0A7M1QTJ9_9ACTO|nr:YciI family protein [Trueperella pecoris]QOQ38811.1 hypothetical protein HLG82_04685 [Trueperella pecoris]QOR44695.1 hypothetical protein INS88_05105 [Trueperella pecoris]QTG74614.1 hypothetical protein J4179_05030 [Trueperella pecoris]